ncbi:VanZ family protein [Amycolatopsis antarctica]|uniref:VanZ family protein n=1 Tax=Amycolatopsis antarctica TaxID=1854586 RepID=A0A263D3V9_9PSEU|nr:VanZ family protein [Amycolatopsis antarctica]OZM72768.1 VanZ family protein [Amycolatopsis antarctica]
MTNAQVTSLQFGLVAFIAVWGVALVPHMLVQRSRHGRIVPAALLRTGAVVLYGCLSLAVLFLPLPGPGTQRLEQTVQLVPFQWITDIGTELGKHGQTAAQALTTQTFQQFALNLALFVPLGLFVRLLWKRGAVTATALGLGISLLVEATQLTANFGTAPFVYRIFDVDDLFSNTAGALTGWIAATLFVFARSAAAARTAARTTAQRAADARVARPVRHRELVGSR